MRRDTRLSSCLNFNQAPCKGTRCFCRSVAHTVKTGGAHVHRSLTFKINVVRYGRGAGRRANECHSLFPYKHHLVVYVNAKRLAKQKLQRPVTQR